MIIVIHCDNILFIFGQINALHSSHYYVLSYFDVIMGLEWTTIRQRAHM